MPDEGEDLIRRIGERRGMLEKAEESMFECRVPPVVLLLKPIEASCNTIYMLTSVTFFWAESHSALILDQIFYLMSSRTSQQTYESKESTKEVSLESPSSPDYMSHLSSSTKYYAHPSHVINSMHEKRSQHSRCSTKIWVVGAIAGGVVARKISHGDRLSTFTGAALGALAAREAEAKYKARGKMQ